MTQTPADTTPPRTGMARSVRALRSRAAGARGRGAVPWWNVAVLVVPVLLVAVMAWERRWITDDGLIVTRTVRELLAGNGPNFNAGERVEADTSALWTYVVAALAWITRADPAEVAVYAGGALTVLGLAFALDGTRRLWVGRWDARRLVPAGVCVLVALPPFWDFSTSGLETGLDFAWMGVAWWLLVRVRRGSGRPWVAAVVVGLGPLVRPEQTVTMVVLLVALVLVARASVWRWVGRVALALVLPVGYEIFRMGYYGLLVPNTALAKEATGFDIARGLRYLGDTFSPYLLWVPAVLLVAAGAAWAVRRRAAARASAGLVAEESGSRLRPTAAAVRRAVLAPTTVVVAAAVVSGVIQLAYVAAIGGDFMHGRMVLPGLYLVLLPLLVLPAVPVTAAASLGLVVWALVCGFGLRVHENGPTSPYLSADGISDERGFYTHWTGAANPVNAEPYVQAENKLVTAVQAGAAAGHPVLIIQNDRGGVDTYVSPARAVGSAQTVVVWDFLGTQGAVLPLNDVAADDFGLGYPLASHMKLLGRGRAGHEKQLPIVWVVADYRAPGFTSPDPAYQQRIDAARRALSCGDLAELQQSVRAPLTAGRFWSNFTGSFSRTTFRFPDDPVLAARAICGS